MKSRAIRGVGSIRLKVVINEYNYDNIRSRYIHIHIYHIYVTYILVTRSYIKLEICMQTACRY